MLSEARARQISARVAASRRRGSLAILSDFVRLVRLDRDRRTAMVESVVALPAHVRERISAQVASAYGAGTRTTFRLNPALLAGLRIRVGSEIYDGSVLGRLAALEARL
jgi:F-type H+-transporting ATPase subunit delta